MYAHTVVLLIGWVAAYVAGGEWDDRGKKIWEQKYPEEFDDASEGDIVKSVGGATGRKNGLRAEVMRWPDGVVKYHMEGPYTLEQCKIIESAFDQYEEKTCIRFQVKNPNDNDYVSIKNNVGCHAELGRIGGEQTLNIGEGPCIKRGTVMHELMHVLGFMHEQKRYDRDSFIRIMYENLKEGKQDNFERQPADVITTFGVQYDYDSITHYSPLAFSKNGEPTVMLTRKNTTVSMGQRDHLSIGDIEKINRMYNCSRQLIVNKPIYPRFC